MRTRTLAISLALLFPSFRVEYHPFFFSQYRIYRSFSQQEYNRVSFGAEAGCAQRWCGVVDSLLVTNSGAAACLSVGGVRAMRMRTRSYRKLHMRAFTHTSVIVYT